MINHLVRESVENINFEGLTDEQEIAVLTKVYYDNTLALDRVQREMNYGIDVAHAKQELEWLRTALISTK